KCGAPWTGRRTRPVPARPAGLYARCRRRPFRLGEPLHLECLAVSRHLVRIAPLPPNSIEATTILTQKGGCAEHANVFFTSTLMNDNVARHLDLRRRAPASARRPGALHEGGRAPHLEQPACLS